MFLGACGSGILRKHVWCRNIGATPVAHRKHWLANSLRLPEVGGGVRESIPDVELRQHQTATHVDLRNHGGKAGETTREGKKLSRREVSNTSRRLATSSQYITLQKKKKLGS